MSERTSAIAGNLCGLFAIIAICAATWLLGSAIWEMHSAIMATIKENPMWTVFWFSAGGFCLSFMYGMRQ